MKFTTAIGVSVALHGVLAAGFAAYMKYVPAPVTTATLDVSSVELSFAEYEDETAAVATSMPLSPPSEPSPPSNMLEPLEPLDAMDKTEPQMVPEPPSPPVPSVGEVEAFSASEEVVQAPRQAKVDAPPRPRKAIRPDYPKGARQRGEQGDVVLEIKVGADGAVERVQVVSSSGYADLDDAAVRAAKAARFVPAKSGMESVASTARLALTFRLR